MMQTSRQHILDFLHREQRASVKELAELLGLTLTGVRQHLAVLQREGLIEAREERGKVGRPAFVYRLTERGAQLFPTRYDELTNLLLEEIRGMAGAEAYQRLLQRIAQRMAGQRQERVQGRSLSERVAVAAEVLTEMGCVVSSEEKNGEFFVYQCTCPYPNVARANRAVCALEVDFIRRLTDADARLVTSLLRGDKACTYRIRPLPIVANRSS